MRPTLNTLVNRIGQDLVSRLEGDARIFRSNLRVLSVVLAGTAHGLYGHLEWVAAQLFPTTADSVNLLTWAGIWGLSQKTATKASGPVTITGTAGAVVASGAELRRVDGALYIIVQDVIIPVDGSISANAEAVETGEDSNVTGGTLAFLASIPGVNGTVTVGTIGGGAAEESRESLRSRLLQRIQQPPQGGAQVDYEGWARAVPGIDRVWVWGNYFGPGTVGICIATADVDDPSPSNDLVSDVQTAINSRRPVTAVPTVFGPALKVVDFTLNISPDSADLRAAVVVALKDLFYREAVPGGLILISHIRETISSVVGEYDNTLGTPETNITTNLGELPVVGEVTWA